MTPELEAKIRAEFESSSIMKGCLFKRRADNHELYWDGNVQDDYELAKALFLAGRVSVLKELEEMKPTCWTRPDALHSYVTHKRVNEFMSDKLYTIPLYRLPPEIEKEMKK
jgi:hypothetical protein